MPLPAMAFAPALGAIVGAASGVALAALGLAVLQVRPWRKATVAFAAFAVLWGAQVVVANLSLMATDVATALPWMRLNFGLVIALYLPLLYFVSVYPRPSGLVARRPVALALLAAPAALLLMVVAASPELLLRGAALNAFGSPTPVPGPLFQPVVVLNSVVAFLIALAIAARGFWRSPEGPTKDQLGLVAAALLAYVSYRSSDVLATLLRAGDFLVAQGAPAFLLRLAAGCAALALVATVLMRVLARHDLPRRDLFLACGSVPFLFGAVEIGLLHARLAEVQSVGLWRLAMVGLFAYAIARYRMFDLELRLQSAWAPTAGYLALTAAGIAALAALYWEPLTATPWLGGLAVVGVATAAVPLRRIAGRAAFRAAPEVATPDYLYKRKLDLYRAAVEEAEAAGAGKATEDAFLDELRRSLGISEKEHRVILLMLEWQQRQPGSVSAAAAAGERFRTVRELGRGGFGRAVLAHDGVLDRSVVLKQPHAPWAVGDDGRQRFLQEARLAARLRHPNVVTVHEVLPDADPPILVMEYIPGGSLADRLEARGRLDPQAALGIMDDVLAGVEVIHRAGIVHRDLKPANILLDDDGRAKITDFGIARAPHGMVLAATLAAEGAQPGSVPYMSPEQVQGGDVDGRSDLYTCGVLLYEVLTGRSYLDLDDKTPPEARRAILAGKPRLPAEGVPQALVPVLLRVLAKDPAQRHATAAELRAALRHASSALPGTGVPQRGGAPAPA